MESLSVGIGNRFLGKQGEYVVIALDDLEGTVYLKRMTDSGPITSKVTYFRLFQMLTDSILKRKGA